MQPLTFLSLFAGIGGFDLGLERAGMVCKGQVEINDYCRKILEKHWPHVRRWGDIRAINPAELPAVDLICGGYPCQPFSQAGQRRGAADDRHLWPEAFRIIKALRPRWLLFENVPGHITLGLTAVLSDLESQGYQVGIRCIPACALDAQHKRQRLWILAHTEQRRLQEFPPKLNRQYKKIHGTWTPEKTSDDITAEGIYRLPDCESLRKGHGLPNRVDRIKALGNAIIPQIATVLGLEIIAAEKEFYHE